MADPSSSPAVRLFADRAAAVQPDFQLDASTAGPVAQICRTLDGMPLAIELAAPWLRTLTPAQLAERLDDRFALLTSGSRASLPRHQTLRATVDWSWQLLSGPERVLARRLAVFPGGATLTAAEQVCADPVPARRAAASGRPSRRRRPAAPGRGPDRALRPGRQVDPDDGGGVRRRRPAVPDARDGASLRPGTAGGGGGGDPVRDALACFFCELAETADPLLRTADQMRWFRLLSAEQDNTHAALRWAVARGDAGTALRLVRALGYYWVQLGHGEGDGLAREVLALTPPDPPTKATAEARVICAMLAAGWSYDLEAVKEQLIEGVAGIAAWADDPGDLHPLAAMAEPLLLQFTGGREQVQAVYDRYATARDPWLRAIGLFYRAQHASEMGRLDGVEEELRVALREFRAMGERWGTALVLTILADVIDLRADDAATIAALEEAVAIGRELNAWGDLAYVEARLAIVRARSGDLARGRSELDRIGRTALARRGQIDIDRWVTFMRAELAWREGDPAAVVDCCTQVLAAFDSYQAVWWEALRARIRGRLALAVLAQGDEARCRELLDAALRAAAAWTEHPALAGVLDACACYALRRPGLAHRRLARHRQPPPTARPAPHTPPSPPDGPSSPPGCSARPTPSAAPSTSRAWTPRRPAPPPGTCSARPPSTPPTGPPPTRPTRPPSSWPTRHSRHPSNALSDPGRDRGQQGRYATCIAHNDGCMAAMATRMAHDVESGGSVRRRSARGGAVMRRGEPPGTVRSNPILNFGCAAPSAGGRRADRLSGWARKHR